MRGSCRRSSESVWPMPWMIPPSIWLDAPSGLITRPTSWIAAMRSTQHLAGLDVDRDLGDLHAEREHLHPGRVRAARALAEDLRVLEQRRRPRRRGIVRSIAALLGDVAAICALVRRPPPRAPPAPSTASSTSPPRASRTGPRAESPIETVTCSSGMPSSSAAICAIAVFVPVPTSCIAVTTAARPSEPTRIQA